MSGEPTFTKSQLYQIIGFISADLPELHLTEAGELIAATDRAIKALTQKGA